MQLFVVFTVFCILSSLSVISQTATIRGTVKDSINQKTLSHTTVSLFSLIDYSLVNYTISDNEGNFILNEVTEGNYIIILSYASYATKEIKLIVRINENKQLGKIILSCKPKILKEVLVKSIVSAIRIKGDSTEFTADSFKVRQGGSVEEMLRKLPGLQIDKDGKIMIMGEEVKKVLVDGEEFFGKNIVMATKNLPAGVINKVQVFDKKSDEAIFSGIDDGKKTKTINLTIKKDRKQGYFGKLELSGGLKDKLDNSIIFNSFKSKRQLSMYGSMSSTGKTSGSMVGENESYYDEPDLQNPADGTLLLAPNGNEQLNPYSDAPGIPKNWSTGINYSNKFNDDRHTINGSYMYSNLINDGSSSTNSQYILPDTIFYQTDNNNFRSSKLRNSGNGTYKTNLDSFTSAIINANAYNETETSKSNYVFQLNNKAGSLVNKSERVVAANGNNSSLNSNMILRRRFKKIGRTISLSFSQQYLTTKTTGFLNSENSFYNNNSEVINTNKIDQMKLYNLKAIRTSTKLIYSEPILKNISLGLSYAIKVSNSISEKLSYDKSGNGKYDLLNDTFSNSYNYHIMINSGGITWRYNSKKLTANLGSDIAVANYRQKNVFNDSVFEYNYNNLFPRSNIYYKLNSNSNVSFSYNGNNQKPTIQQIQPIQDNSNTLTIFIGNPYLKQEFKHSFNLTYNFNSLISQKGFYTNYNFNTISNAITTNQYTSTSGDSIGKTIYQYVNIDGNFNSYVGGGYYFKLIHSDIQVNPSFDININENHNRVNNVKNVTNNESYEIGVGISRYKENKYSIFINSRIIYNKTRSSIRQNLKTLFLSQSHNFSLNYNLPFRMEVNTEINVQMRQKTSAFGNNNNVILWNAYIGKRFFKNDKGLISFRGNDLLNKNKGVVRYINSNVITESSFNMIKRYFQLNFTWNFSKTSGSASKIN